MVQVTSSTMRGELMCLAHNIQRAILESLSGEIVEDRYTYYDTSFSSWSAEMASAMPARRARTPRVHDTISPSTVYVYITEIERFDFDIRVNAGNISFGFVVTRAQIMDSYNLESIAYFCVSELQAHIDQICQRPDYSFRRIHEQRTELQGGYFVPPDFAEQIYSRQRPVNEKALELLEECLTETQLEQYRENKWFLVVGGETGDTYQINNWEQINIHKWENGERTGEKLCVAPTENIPVEDHLLAQKLMIENEEDRFLELAISW